MCWLCENSSFKRVWNYFSMHEKIVKLGHDYFSQHIPKMVDKSWRLFLVSPTSYVYINNSELSFAEHHAIDEE